MIFSKIRLSLICFVFVALLANTSVKAQLSFMVDDTIKIDEVIVTGTPVKVSRNNVPLSVSVVDRSQIQETEESALLPVLNGRVPGLFVTERGITGFGVAQGSAGQISIRGIGGNPTTGVLMLIDGHPQFMGIMGHPLPDSYVASDVERVEVIRGPASILYGSNAMGGVINIITRKQTREGVNGNGRISFGSHNTQKYMGSAGVKKDKLSAFVSLNHDKTDGHRPHSDFKITNGYVKLGYDINPHLYASTDLSMAAFKAADPGPDTLNATHGNRIDIDRGYWAFTLQNEFDNASGSVKLFYNFGEHVISDGFHSNDHNYGLNLYEAFKFFEGNNITIGLDYMNYGGLAKNTKAMGGKGIVFADTTIQELGIYAFVQQEVNEKLTVNAGLRQQNNSVYGNKLIPSTGFAFKFDERTTWKGNYSKGFRSPTMRELFMWNPNPDLKPESVTSIETGISRSFFNQRMSAEVVVYALNGDKMIVNVPLKGYQNTGKVNNKGIELAIVAEPVQDLTINATYSYIHMENPVFATPQQHLYLNAHYKTGKFHFTAGLQQVSDLDNDPSPVVNKVSYALVNARASYGITSNIRIFASGENLLDTRYEVNRYYTMPGTTAFTGISLNF